MKSSRLLTLLCCLTLSALTSAKNVTDTLWCVASTDNDLAALLKQSGYVLQRAADNHSLLSQAPKGASVLLLGDGSRSMQQLTEADLSLIGEKRLSVFADFAALPGTSPQVREATVERVVVKEAIGLLKPMDLLTVNRARFIPSAPVRPILVLARVAGFDDAVFGLKDTEVFPLVDMPREGLTVSTAYLSDFSKLRLMPEGRWQAFWEAMLGRMTGKNVHFATWPSLVWPAFGKDEVLPRNAKTQAVRRGVDWFWGGHFLVHESWREELLIKHQDFDPPMAPAVPVSAPVGDGSLGMLEGHCSAIDADGHQAYRYWLRADVHGETAMALTLASRLLHKKKYAQTAERILDFIMAAATAGPRQDPASPSYGLVSWGLTNYSQDVYYGDDNARFLLGAILAARLMKETRWDDKIRAAIDANFQTTGLDGFRGHRIEERDLQKNGREFYRNRHIFDPQPHFESWMWAVYLWLYSQTGEQEFLDLSKKGIALTMKAYPAEWRWTNGIQQERARMVLPLAWLYRVEPTDEHKAWLDEIVGELRKNQDACGAIREELGDPSKGQFGGPRSNADYGRSEAPLINKNGDPVADMLYTSNFAIFGLNEAARATGDPVIGEMTSRLADFLVRIQARSAECPDVEGAWYRAFNYRDWNWWASNADAGWGALGTLTGWTQSWIVGTLAMMQMKTSYWDLTH